MIVSGIKVRPLVCSTKNMICALVAFSLSGLIDCKLSMAFKPKGVAALSSPSILALKFITICPMAGCFSGTSGNNLFINGFKSLAIQLMAPARSAIFMSPKKKTIVPANGKATSITEPLALSNIPSTRVLNTSVSCKNKNL